MAVQGSRSEVVIEKWRKDHVDCNIVSKRTFNKGKVKVKAKRLFVDHHVFLINHSFSLYILHICLIT